MLGGHFYEWRDWLEAWVVDAGAAAGEATCVFREQMNPIYFSKLFLKLKFTWNLIIFVHRDYDLSSKLF